MLSLQITQESADLRLDKFLCHNFDISFGLAQKIIREKKVKVNGNRTDPSYKLADLDQVEIFTDLKKRLGNSAKKEAQKAKISVEKIKNFWSWKIFEDENLLAINKPSGLATQGGSGIEFCVDDVLFHLNLERKPQEKMQLVHRLDKDTSGILLIAKNSKSAEFLTDAFRNKTIGKTYLALVSGIVKKPDGVINIPLRKKLVGKNEKVQPDFDEGKEAITNYKLLKVFADDTRDRTGKIRHNHDFYGFRSHEDRAEEELMIRERNAYSLLELKPITGRTHQLRVHCKEIGHAVLNDGKYGGKEVLRKDVCKRLCLHAYRIELEDYFGGKLEIETELPEFCQEKAKTFTKTRRR